jgi:isopentenyl diphosphate isomerase/L-lactate dehydrogenase-like FMN-dependent dehydrogenase
MQSPFFFYQEHSMSDIFACRRRLLAFLAGSPLLRSAALGTFSLDALAQIAEDRDYLAPSPELAANVFDMENLARQNISRAHWTYISQGVDDELTLRANHEAYQRLHLKARRLIDVSKTSIATTLFGESLPSPILLAPVGGLGMAHADGDKEAAAGAALSGHKMVMSTAATFGIEEVVAARGGPVWYQLYTTNDWRITQGLVRKAEANGSTVMFLTVDIPARNQDRMRRFDRTQGECVDCHDPDSTFADKAMLRGLDAPRNIGAGNPAMDWDFVKRLKDFTKMKLVIKGVTQPEDALLAIDSGVDGVLVSNHGGRADESGYATIDSLPEVVAAVNGRCPVLVDGGIRRGTDVFKALALGADAVLVGRPYVWGLGAFGRYGVDRVMKILDAELDIAMRQAGTPTLADINTSFIRRG